MGTNVPQSLVATVAEKTLCQPSNIGDLPQRCPFARSRLPTGGWGKTTGYAVGGEIQLFLLE